jgi:hypothetical protein
MQADGRLARSVWLWLLGLALGWFEAAVVVYLRRIYYPDGFHFPVVVAHDRILLVEVVREAASLLLLAAAARLAGRHFLERFAAFMLLFGIWDLTYYAGLWIALGWPTSLADWDVLFLIPVPWLAPVWAPCVVSLLLVGVGARLYWTAERPRAIQAGDWLLAVTGGLLVIASFLADWRAVPAGRMPAAFPAWLFGLGCLVGLGAFVNAEWRRPWSDSVVDRAPGPARPEVNG